MRHAIVTALLLAACGADSDVSAPPTSPPPSKQAAPRAAKADHAPASDAMKTLAGVLADEARARPTGTARVEDVFVALGAAGVRVDDVKQYLGRTAKARYCAGGTTADGLAIAVCEYASAADAAAGRAWIDERFAALAPNRRIHVRGATTMSLTTAPERVEGDDVRRAADAFANL